MSINIKPILGIAPLVQSAVLAEHSFGLLKKRKKRKLFGVAADTMIGTAIIKAESDMIGEM